jgi:hypothetical protein
MAYKQNNPFSRKTSSPLNHGTHTDPYRGGPLTSAHEGHGENNERSGIEAGTSEVGPYEGYDTIEELRANRINVGDETAKLLNRALEATGGSGNFSGGSYNRDAINAQLKMVRNNRSGRRAYENLFNSPQRSKLYDFDPETMVDW